MALPTTPARLTAGTGPTLPLTGIELGLSLGRQPGG